MVNFAPHTRVAFGGTIQDNTVAAAKEIWQCNINVVFPDGVAPDQATYMESIAPGLLAWFKAANNGMCVLATLDYLKVNAINAAGHYANQAVNLHEYQANDFSAGGAQPKNSPICSLAYSWATSRRAGPGAHGRIYPPNYTYGNAGGQLVTTADTVSAVNAARRLLNVIGNIGTDAAIPVIASGVNGTNTPITSVRVGNVIDVQRRRKDAYREEYSALSYPA